MNTNLRLRSKKLSNLTGILMSIVAIGFSGSNAQADWKGFVDELKSTVESRSKGGLTPAEIADGLKEALRVGTKKTVDRLGKQDGFYKDKSIKIPMPDKLRKVEKLLRKTGQGKLADRFIKTMNRAAEQSAKTTFSILLNAIKKMTLKDAVNIYRGREDEATRYFRKTKSVELHKNIHPIVRKATQQTGVTSSYKKLSSKVKILHPSLAKNMPDIDNYVTQKTMDGIFHKVAREEALIRKDPAARTTEILKKVFSQ